MADILRQTGAEAILAKFHVPCLTCPMAQMEMPSLRIGEVCKIYGLEQAKLLAELNKLQASVAKPKPAKKSSKAKK